VEPFGQLCFKINGTWAYLKDVNELTEYSKDAEGNDGERSTLQKIAQLGAESDIVFYCLIEEDGQR
jgi:hypothetical protein